MRNNLTTTEKILFYTIVWGMFIAIFGFLYVANQPRLNAYSADYCVRVYGLNKECK